MTPARPIPRRAFLAGAGAAVVAGRAWAQQRNVVRMALVATGFPVERMDEAGEPRFKAFFAEMRRLGYIEGGNLFVARWSTSGIPEDRWSDLARRIVAGGPEIIVANGSRLVLALKDATPKVPILFSASAPVEYGIVASLARPGGNVTGFAADTGPENIGKRLQYLIEIHPRMSRVFYLGTSQLWQSPVAEELRRTARLARRELEFLPVAGAVTAASVEQALGSLPEPTMSGVVLSDGTDILAIRDVIARVTRERRIATVGLQREHADAGCLLTFGPSLNAIFVGIAGYADRILRGTKPGDLPVQQPMLFDFVINKKTADALGLEIPLGLWVQATEILE